MQSLRRRIDRLDRKLLTLLNERAGLAVKVGAEKRQQGLALHDPSREREVLRGVAAANAGPVPAAAVRKIFRLIMSSCRDLERHT